MLMRTPWFASLATASLLIASPRIALAVPSVSFAPPTYTDLPKWPTRVLLADLNNDGRLDAVVAYGGGDIFYNSDGYLSVSVFLGTGDGGFGPRSDIPIYPVKNAGSSVKDIAIGDINGDGNADLVTSGLGVTMLLGLGDGGFGSPSVVTADPSRALQLVDLNGDGKLDLVATTGTTNILMFPGIQGGSFGGKIVVPTPTVNTTDVAIGDLNMDGIADLAIVGYTRLTILLGSGNFTYSLRSFYDTFDIYGAPNFYIVLDEVADMNADGKLDLIVSAALWVGSGNGDFARPVAIGEFGDNDAAVIDLNRDGILDVAWAHNNVGCPGCCVSVVLGRGDGSFQSSTQLAAGEGPTAGSNATSIASGDLNGDGNPDLAVTILTAKVVGDPHLPKLAVFLNSLPPNQSPTVALTSPAAGAVFTAPATVNLAATASDPDGTVTKVEFFQGSVKLGEDATAADGFAFTWTGVPAGTYALTARATDNAGAVTTSTAVNVTVNAAVAGPPNQPPTVSLVSPADGSLFTPGADIAIEAAAADGDGTVAKVEFFQGTTLLGEAAVAPYRFTWSDAPAGSYTLTARATDNAGAVTTSSPARVRVGVPDAGGGGACFSAPRPPNRPGAGGPFLALVLLWGAVAAIRSSPARAESRTWRAAPRRRSPAMTMLVSATARIGLTSQRLRNNRPPRWPRHRPAVGAQHAAPLQRVVPAPARDGPVPPPSGDLFSTSQSLRTNTTQPI